MRRSTGLLFLLICIPAFAQVYKWVDKDGVVHYTDQPPAKDSTPASLPPLQTYKGGTVPRLEDYAPPERKNREPLKVTITSPSQDETYRGDAQGQVSVSVSVTPFLAGGQQLRYYVNGSPHGGPTPSQSMSLSNLERGSHSITVAVVDAQGEEVARSEAVTVHMKPPQVAR